MKEVEKAIRRADSAIDAAMAEIHAELATLYRRRAALTSELDKLTILPADTENGN